MRRVVLSKLNPTKVVHPDDQAVISRMNKIPGFKTLLKNTVVKFSESLADVTYMGNGYDITANSNPRLHRQFMEDCKILGMKKTPQFSTAWGYFISSQSVGEKKRRILVTSGAVDLLESEELDFLLGHELGHILCGHIPYHMLVEAMYMPLFTDNSGLGLVDVVRLPMLEWYRISHYTADRMGLLCCQDIDVALRTMIKMSGLPKECYDNIDVKAFIKQADEFAEVHDSAMDKIAKVVTIMSADSPWMVVRAKKLLDWYESGDYQAIINRR